MADPIQQVLQAFAQGELVVVTDDDDREGEGDLIVAASMCTAEKMAFIIRHTSGIVCAPITIEDARRLRLDPMVATTNPVTPLLLRFPSTTSPTAVPGFRRKSAPHAAARWPTRMSVPAISRAPATYFR